MNRLRYILIASIFGFGPIVLPAGAGILPATQQAEFMNGIEPDFYKETFDSLMPNVPYSDALSFSQGSFGFEILADGRGTDQGIYPLENQEQFGDVWLSTNYDGTTIDIRNIQGDANAVGGEFFVSAFEANVTAGLISVFAESVSGQTMFQSNVTGLRNFFGFYATEGMRITRLTIELPSAFNYATLNNLIIAQRIGGDPITITAVPEPSGIAMMAIGIGSVGYLASRRRNRLHQD